MPWILDDSSVEYNRRMETIPEIPSTSSPKEFRATKQPNQSQYVNHFKKVISSKSKLLKQLEQLNIDVSDLQSLSLNELRDKCEDIFRQSYSFKYIGIRDNQIGILSKRLMPNSLTADILPNIENKFVVTEFFYPRPLKTIIRQQEPQSRESVENVIKFVHPNVQKKERMLDSKLRGSWINLKERLRGKPDRESELDMSAFRSKVPNNSYSRTLQEIQKRGLEMSPGKTLYSSISKGG